MDAEALLDAGGPGSRPEGTPPAVDLRSITNAARQLAYHVARQRGHRCVGRRENFYKP